MTYEQNIRKASKRIESAHRGWLIKGVIISRTRAQAKEAIDMQAEAVRRALKCLSMASDAGIDTYLFSQGLSIVP